MADTTKALAEQSIFVFVKDSNTGNIRRVAIPSDVQIGLQGNPSELQLLGRLSLSATDYSTDARNKGILYVDNNDTIVSVSVVDTPSSGRVTLYLPGNPRNGQLHFIKDMSGTADTVPVDVIPVDGVKIDQYDSRTLTDKFGSIALYWFGDKWRILVAGLGVSSSGAADSAATYITLSNNVTLTNERRLNTSGTNITLTDQGPNASVIIDLTSILGAGAGSFTYTALTVDSFGRITSVANGTPPPPVGASYITVANESGLTAERAFAVGSGLLLTDGGANGTITTAINNNIVATLTGSIFTGQVVAMDGFSGSLQQLSTGISYLIAGAGISITTQSNGQILISSSVTNVGADISASYVTLNTTSSLPNERALSASFGLLLQDNGAGSTVSFSINDNDVATLSGSKFRGPISASGGLSGSLQQIALNLSYLVAGTNVSIATQSNGQIVVSSTFVVTASWADISASYVTLNNTSSLPNERALSASFGLLLTDNGANSTVNFRVNDNDIATLSGSTFRGPVSASGGLTGSLQQIASNLSYLVAGTNVSIVTQSNGQIVVSNTFAVTASWADISASYVTLNTTSSLPNERALSASFGLLLTDNGANSTVNFRVNDNDIATLSGSTFRGPVSASGGLTGSLQQVATNLSYLVAGSGITVTSQSNGQIIITSTSTSSVGSSTDVSASYIVIGNTSSLPNERALSAGSGITITDNGANSTVVVSMTIPPVNPASPSAFHGFTTSSVFWAATGSWTLFTGALGDFSDIVTSSISRNGSQFTVTNSGMYFFHAGFNAYGSDAYISLRLRESGSNNVVLKRSTYRSTPTDQNLVVLDGVFSASVGSKWLLEYISSGTIYAWTASNPLPNDSNMGTGEVSIFLAATPTVPIFSIPILAGTVITNTATDTVKQTLGAIFFNPTMINTFPGIKKFWWRAIVDVLSTEPNMSASVDLYDINGIVAFPPGIITGSIMSSSSATMIQIQSNLTSQLQSVTGSGIFEARLWRTVSGSLTSSVTCRNARIEVEFT